jgi:DNA-binding transcriptional ArsR family regulator
MQSVDITSSSLAALGYSLKIQGPSVLFESTNGASHKRFTIYAKDWNRTEKAIVKQLEDSGFKQDIIQLVLKDMSSNFQTVVASGKGELGRQNNLSSTQGLTEGPKMASKAIRAGCSMEEWRKNVKTKYDRLKETADANIPGLWLPLEFAISIRAILNIQNISLPFIGIVLGPPSSLKSVSVDMMKNSRETLTTDNFSPKAFVSHNSNLTEEQLQENDLLPKVKNKMLLVSELAPLFGTKDDELANAFGIIRRIADGNGYFSDSGARGHRGYPGPLMFTWVGAAVDIPYKVHKLLSMLGPKLYFLRLPMSVRDIDSIVASMQQDNFKERMNAVKSALFDYLEYFESCPDMQIDPTSGIPKIHWDSANPIQIQTQTFIAYLAELLAYLRGTVATWKTEDTQGLDYAYTSRNVENPERAIQQLHNLTKGHALSQGRDHITVDDDLPLITKVVLSGAASIERVKVFNQLLQRKDRGYMSTNDLMETMLVSDTTAKKAMAELKALGLVDIIDIGEDGRPFIQMRLKDNFDWFYGDEFKKLKGDYTPGDFKNFLIKKGKNKDGEEDSFQTNI